MIDKKNAEKAIRTYLNNKREVTSLEREMDKMMKEVIEPFAVENAKSFVDDCLETREGRLKYAKNPAKLTDADGDSLSGEVKDKLLCALPEKYIKSSIDVTLINSKIEKDKLLRKVLESEGVTVKQDLRLSVKEV